MNQAEFQKELSRIYWQSERQAERIAMHKEDALSLKELSLSSLLSLALSFPLEALIINPEPDKAIESLTDRIKESPRNKKEPQGLKGSLDSLMIGEGVFQLSLRSEEKLPLTLASGQFDHVLFHSLPKKARQ